MSDKLPLMLMLTACSHYFIFLRLFYVHLLYVYTKMDHGLHTVHTHIWAKQNTAIIITVVIRHVAMFVTSTCSVRLWMFDCI